ncbi:AAA family ATPase [Mycobacterium sp. 21AC1]|uniref:ParA-like protein n=1 Tax=Mycolicibacterium hippocampi TaxID=659824 RepID=A0A850PLR2_9MYCO|nr:AAA family ATPase [Mycobacterium sp. 21AC1]MDV3130370.1 AAA family ATPase [Mycobacterium sp. 21AC1]NVN51272.1 ParA-like protein [Mycolicibacterium hippocampi]
MQPKRHALANQKGGVGKTATTLGLASAISHRGGRALIVDVDPQANATEGLGVYTEDGQLTTADLMDRTEAGSAIDAVVATDWDGVDLIPSHLDLSNAESSGASDLVFRLDVAFEGLDLSPYDAVLFDCPPSLGKLLFAVLLTVDTVYAITEPTKDSVKGVTRLETTVQKVKLRPNPRLELAKIIISRRQNKGEHIDRERELREAYGDLVARTVIPDLGARQDAHSAEVPMHKFKGGRALSLQVAYDDLADELGITIGAPA